MNVGSLFSGIGGLDLGLERAGMTIIWQCEHDPYASRVLAGHWPHVRNLGDITAVDWSSVERPDLICGGFPCQPASQAGAQRGIHDERWLWPEFARALRGLRPDHVLVENVPGLLTVNDGRAMAEVLGDLAALGYDSEWECIPAAAVGAPHLRWRLFVLAHADRERQPQRRQQDGAAPARLDAPRRLDPGGCGAAVADPHSPAGVEARATEPAARPATTGRGPAQPRGQTRGGRRAWPAEPSVGRVAHGVPARVDRLRCLGNAVVPQVAELIGRRILEAAP